MKSRQSPGLSLVVAISAIALMMPWLAARAESASAGDADLFARLDLNGDGLLTAREVSSEHRRLFDRLMRRADENEVGALSRDEFLAALVPSRPEKPIEGKQSVSFPNADAVRYLLLTLDTNENAVIEADELPDDGRRLFRMLLDRLDRDDSGALEPLELSRGGPALAMAAGRYVESRGIDVAAELDKLKQAQGRAAERFDGRRPPVEMLADPRQARVLFARLDANGDGFIERDEVPKPVQPQIERFLRLADRDADDRLSLREFLAGGERISRFLSRPR